MSFDDRYDSLIKYYCKYHFPEIDWLIVKAQVWQESRFKTKAISSAGCMGLMQISRELAKERLAQPAYVWCADTNLELGIKYLKEQYDHFPEIPDHFDKIRFALASYNGGRGYINAAIRLARRDKQDFWKWAITSPYLACPDCVCRSKRPDHLQITNYTSVILSRYLTYLTN